MSAQRTLCVWCPDWPVVTARRAHPELAGVPVAVVDRIDGRVVVCAASREAREETVVPGLRRREAEARCAGIVVVEADPAADMRAFEAVARAIETITPRVVLERPGVCTFPTRGPSRYFGGDAALAALVLHTVRAAGVSEARVGIADGSFAARLAARAADVDGAQVIEPDATATFLAPWPVRALIPTDVEPDRDVVALADLLVRLGVKTLGAFAALPASAVLARFGTHGARLHRLASGIDEHPTPPAPPPPELIESAELDPPATRVDEAAFAAKTLADRLLGRLAGLGLSCSQVVVEAETEHGERLARCWRHEGALSPAALVDRVRWQLEGWLTAGASASKRPTGMGAIEDDGFTTGGLTLVRLVPEEVAPADGRQLGFWGGDAAARDRADRVLARLQGLLGHDAVVTAVPCGGRTPAERVRWVPWGDARDLRDDPARADGHEWPGTVPGPSPARVFAPALAAELLDDLGAPVGVSGRGEATAAPARLVCAALPDGGGPVQSWAGPWLHDVRWWDRVTRRRRALWHVVVGVESATACLVGLESGRATVEAIYD